MKYILFDDDSRLNLLPFTHTRPIADIRCGIFTMRERWETLFNTKTGTLTEPHLQKVFPLITESTPIIENEPFLLVNGSVFGNKDLAAAINNLEAGEQLVYGNTLIAAKCANGIIELRDFKDEIAGYKTIEYSNYIYLLRNIWDIFSFNDRAIREDFILLTEGRNSQPIPDSVMISGNENIFIEPGGKINMGCIINATTGPVYIGKNAEILEGSILRGPISLGEKAVIKMGAKIYGATTIGTGCKVGGEISNVVFFANSNKGHDGYLGNAVIGEWCNLGADTNSSNLKNNYDEIKIWSECDNKMTATGLIFCGLMMADHSKCGINTMFNTGTVVGVSANIFGSNFPEKFIPSFTWGGTADSTTYDFEKAMETVSRMMARRDLKLTDAEKELYKYIFDKTAYQRQN